MRPLAPPRRRRDGWSPAAATDLPSGQDQRATSISPLAKDIVLSLLGLVAGKAGGFGIRTHHPIAGVTTSESLEAPATRRRITLQVLVHHAQHLACTHGDRVVRAHRRNAEGTRPGHVVCEGDGIVLLLTRRRMAGENGTGMVKTVGYAFPETAASAGRSLRERVPRSSSGHAVGSATRRRAVKPPISMCRKRSFATDRQERRPARAACVVSRV